MPVRGPYSYLVEAKGKRLFYMAGLLAIDEKGKPVGKGDMKAQIRQIISNVEKVLKDAGGSLKDIVRIGVFTTDLPEFLKLGKWRSKTFPQLWNYKQQACASTAIGISALAAPVYLIEIDAVAALK